MIQTPSSKTYVYGVVVEKIEGQIDFGFLEVINVDFYFDAGNWGRKYI